MIQLRASEVEIGERYKAKVSGRVVTVRITGTRYDPYRSKRAGWDAVNEETGRSIIIKSGQRLRERVE